MPDNETKSPEEKPPQTSLHLPENADQLKPADTEVKRPGAGPVMTEDKKP